MSQMKKVFGYWGIIVSVLASIVIAPTHGFAQSDDADVLVVPAGETVKIGIATDLSNLLPAPGLDIAQAANLAILQYNDAGGLMGFEIETLIEDDLCTAEGAVEVAEGFIERGDVTAVVGHVCSSASIPASELYEEALIPMVSASSTAGAFTERGLMVANRTAFNDNLQGVVAAQYIFEDLDVSNIAILHNDTSYGLGLATTVNDTFMDAGGNVLAFRAIDLEALDYEELLVELEALGPQLIYFGGYDQEGSVIVEQMDLFGLQDVIFFAADGLYNQDFLDFAGDASNGTYVTFGITDEDSEAKIAFVDAYTEEYGTPPDALGPYHAESYDAAGILLAALEAVAEVDDDGNLVIDRMALVEAVRTTEGFEGLTGVITCSESGDCSPAAIGVFQAVDGVWEAILSPEDED